MKSRANEQVEHHTCPEHVTERLRVAGGINRFGDPLFRLIWGYDRIVPIYGEWQEFEQYQVTIKAVPSNIKPASDEPMVPVNPHMGIVAGDSQTRLITKLKRSVIETRLVPKYLPANCWHLEMWRPPEEYGSPEQWGKLGQEIIGLMTVNTSGPYPERGEYELCYPITHDGSNRGRPLPLIDELVVELVRMIKVSKERFTYQQRRAAIEQREIRADKDYVESTVDRLKENLKPWAGNEYIIKP